MENSMLRHAVESALGKAVVLFSGGRDSTLSLIRTVLRNQRATLIVVDTGFGVGTHLLNARLAELTDVLGEDAFEVERIPAYGLVRNISLRTLEADIQRYGVNLIPLGESLAIHSVGVVRCLQLGIDCLVNGFSGYQRSLPEQSPEGAAGIERFVSEFGIRLQSPVISETSVQAVQYELMEYGVTPKSVEPVSVFADTCSTATGEQVASYIDSRLPYLREFVGRFAVTAQEDA